MLEICLLGQFNVSLDGQLVDIPTRPSRLLLASLLLHRDAPQPRETLADLLWPDSSAANGRANLRHALWQLRAAIDPPGHDRAAYVLHTPQAIAFNRASAYRLDVEVLEQERPLWTTAGLMAATAVYTGELLPGFHESWVVLAREQLTVVLDRRMGRLLARLMDEERWDDTLVWAERWIGFSALSEPAYRAQMRAYAALGDAGRVVAVYRRCRELLAAELGIEPSPETRQLLEHLTAHSGRRPPFSENRNPGRRT